MKRRTQKSETRHTAKTDGDEAFLLEKKTRQDRAKAPSDASEVLLIQRVEQEVASHTALSRLMSEQQLVSQISCHVM